MPDMEFEEKVPEFGGYDVFVCPIPGGPGSGLEYLLVHC